MSSGLQCLLHGTRRTRKGLAGLGSHAEKSEPAHVAGNAVARCALGLEVLNLLGEHRRLCGCPGFRLGGLGIDPSSRLALALGDSALLAQAEDLLLVASALDPDRRLADDGEIGLTLVRDATLGVSHEVGKLSSVASGDQALNPIDARPCQLGLQIVEIERPLLEAQVAT